MAVKHLISFATFLFAGLLEIGGGYLVWLALRSGKPSWYGIVGGLLLALYGVVATFQRDILATEAVTFGRVYAAYGGIFILMSTLWGWGVDGRRPDHADIIGALVCLVGSGIIIYWPR